MRCHMKCLMKKLKLRVIELVPASIHQIISPVAASFGMETIGMIASQSGYGIAHESVVFG
jgi:hypothetical protein